MARLAFIHTPFGGRGWCAPHQGNCPEESPCSRNFTKRKYRPGFESLERKQLMSAGIPSCAVVPVPPVVALVPTHLQNGIIRPCGTGKGIRIITS